MEEIKLTQYSHGAGCGCKIAPSVLEEILSSGFTQPDNDRLLVGNSSKDDAAAYALDADTALISTTDFFMPIVDDPYDFGRIASANAISDVYAMGGKPILAVALLGWPVDKLPAKLAKAVVEGSKAICAEAGIPLAGGHTIDSSEPLFGLAVNGLAKISHLKRNNTARPGDLLFLTKPIGVGILATALKRGLLQADHLDKFVKQMTTLNKVGEVLGKISGVTAMTDVTGFGMLGHLIEMAEGSDLSVNLHYSKLPVLPEARQYLQQQIVPDATYRNWNSYGNKIELSSDINVMEAFNLLPDPQTNGGLLIAADPGSIQELTTVLNDFDLSSFAAPIGSFIPKTGKIINVNF